MAKQPLTCRSPYRVFPAFAVARMEWEEDFSCGAWCGAGVVGPGRGCSCIPSSARVSLICETKSNLEAMDIAALGNTDWRSAAGGRGTEVSLSGDKSGYCLPCYERSISSTISPICLGWHWNYCNRETCFKQCSCHSPATCRVFLPLSCWHTS